MPPILLFAAASAAAFGLYKWQKKWFIASAPAGSQVPFGADRSGNTVVMLVPGQDLGTLVVAAGANGAQVAAQTPDGSSITSYTSSNPAIFPESPLSQPNTGTAFPPTPGPGVAVLVFSSDAGWRSSFTVQAQ